MIYISTPKHLRAGAKRIQELGVKPELEVFDTGHLWFAKQMVKEGLLDGAAAVPALPRHSLGRAGRHHLHEGDGRQPARRARIWAGFGIGRMQMPMVAQAMLLGGNVRVGLEDNLWLDKGVYRLQRPAGRARDRDHPAPGRAAADAGRGAQEARPAAAQLAAITAFS